jgi:hypothetical protein
VKRGGVYDRSIRAFSLIYLVIGVVVLAMTVIKGGGPTSIGFLIGLAFIGVGVGRYVVQRKVTEDDSR